MGSGVFAGIFDIDEILAKEDIDGVRLGDELVRIGYAGDAPVNDHKPESYFELHIEQGPILEAEGNTIGVVTAAQGQRWYEITVTGQVSHAGPKPMAHRKDALVVASAIVSEVNRIGHAYPPNACATVGFMQVSPNSRNVIPGSVFLTIDFQHPDNNTLSDMDSKIKAFCTQIIDDTGVQVDVVDFWHFPPTPFDKDCVAALREGAVAHGYAHMDIVSGAGHDAAYLNSVAPAGMIFIPCEDGISHNETENVSLRDCAAGCNVLLHAGLARVKKQLENYCLRLCVRLFGNPRSSRSVL